MPLMPSPLIFVVGQMAWPAKRNCFESALALPAVTVAPAMVRIRWRASPTNHTLPFLDNAHPYSGSALLGGCWLGGFLETAVSQ